MFYLRGVAPHTLETGDIYRGAVPPFVVIQLIALVLLALVPELATWLPAHRRSALPPIRCGRRSMQRRQ